MKGDSSKTNIIVKNDTLITSHMKDYTGIIFEDKWICLKPVGRNYNNRMLWEFECSNCHKKIIRTACNIKGCTCECKHHRTFIYSMSFYDWCKQNNHNDWIELWDYDLNDYDIHNIGYSSDCYCWFKCSNHNSSHKSEKYKLSNLTNGCQKGILCRQCNSFAQWGIDNFGENFLNIYWDYDKNTLSPWNISKGSGKKVWIKCYNGFHDSFLTAINNCVKRFCSCPECRKEQNISRLHMKVIKFLKLLNYDISTEFNCSIIAKNPKTNHYLPYDIEVNDLNLIIEVQGEQHYVKNRSYNILMAKRMNISNEESLEYRKWIDNYKKEFAINNGYNYLEIPYTFEKNDEYKNLIINKLKEIKS